MKGKKGGFRVNKRKPDAPKYDFSYVKKVEKDKGKEVGPQRLNKYLAHAGICSRREADKLIEQGLVKVNGKKVTELGYKVQIGDQVEYKGKLVKPEKLIYLLLNKPKSFLTTTKDPEERKTVMDLVSNACEERIFPVGRLDRNTTGLLLLTNDGDLADKLMHPSNNIKKVYQVTLDKPITEDDFNAINSGLKLEDGPAPVDGLSVITPDGMTLGIEIHIGRNRIVRRIFEHLGYDVVKLDRTLYAGLTKKDLARGKWRFLNQKEVARLKIMKLK
ncbi:pseudouridine synthase [Marinigracilibium pacificum]|uniref:Pseudouridine synthase n=1 Tax=Marinigracilibium pacificum TaxID=2729599 RepID=A0A848IVC8_9BACT|nr:pseudouridine synthase [Marinigracilibium pacificum]NMM47191.1 rRNA pseudouridine synthase [Marinigracilibium pacificum]